MSAQLDISFSKSAKTQGALVLVMATTGEPVPAQAIEAATPGVAEKAARVQKFTAKALSTLDLVAGPGSDADRVVLVGLGERDKMNAQDWIKAGGKAASMLGKAGKVVLHLPDAAAPENAADLALGMLLRAYAFDRYKTRKGEDDDNKPKSVKVTIVHADASACKKAFADAEAVAGGVILARDCVNEPANTLGPVEFADKAKALEALGAEVEILTEKEMKKLGMGALLGVAQGSVRPARMAVIHWKGGKAKDKPVAFVGKGVVFDTGGISIKPAGGMEDMKGDMGGAAAVIGLMHTLCARKARVNAIGILGLVENMPDGNAQRPGDIVTSMSGQTIEVINTDAEGRLVLCDALHYCEERFKPAAMINLATLTGAIMVALGSHHAGLFSNNDDLAAALSSAGEDTGEKVWRMPLGPEYDKMIDSRFADMKNTGGRNAGAITAAQFLKRFVKDTPWAHLDVAGTAMGSPSSEINQSWGSGFGVRLLDAYVRSTFEK